jgi:hypothetical protein
MRFTFPVNGSALILVVMGSFVMAEDKPRTLFDFNGTDALKEWQTLRRSLEQESSQGVTVKG